MTIRLTVWVSSSACRGSSERGGARLPHPNPDDHSSRQNDITKIMGVVVGTAGRGRRSHGTDLPVPQRPSRLQEPPECVREFASCRCAVIGQVALDVVDSTRQDVQLVMQLIEFRTGNHQFVLTQFELCCTMPRHPIPLTAPTRAEHTRPTRPRALREGSATPTAVLRLRSSAVSTHGQLRHDVIVVA